MRENTEFTPIVGSLIFYREACYNQLPDFTVYAKVQRHGEEVWWPIGFIAGNEDCRSYSHFHGYYPPNPIGVKFREFAHKFLKELNIVLPPS